MKLKDAVCIVTGAGTGTGAACAVQLARKGCHVVVNYNRSKREARDVVDKCIAAGGEALVAKGDVAEDKDCRALAQAALDKWGRIDALINNAGVTKFTRADDLEALDAEDFQRIYAVNVIGAYQMTRACVPAMKKQGVASIVNISSLSGVRGGWIVDCLYRVQGRAQRNDPGAGARARPGNPRQCRVPRTD